MKAISWAIDGASDDDVAAGAAASSSPTSNSLLMSCPAKPGGIDGGGVLGIPLAIAENTTVDPSPLLEI